MPKYQMDCPNCSGPVNKEFTVVTPTPVMPSPKGLDMMGGPGGSTVPNNNVITGGKTNGIG